MEAVSLIDASQMDAVHTAVNSWATVLQARVGASKVNMTTARSNAQKIDIQPDWVSPVRTISSKCAMIRFDNLETV
jgi:hypothetical protein